jgi:hypothetical protein
MRLYPRGIEPAETPNPTAREAGAELATNADTSRTNNLYISRCPRKPSEIDAPERSRTPNPQSVA